jgi:hypothetical protein
LDVNEDAYLEISTLTMSGIYERSDFEFLKGESKNPIFGNAFDAFEAIPACEWPMAI